MENLNLKIDSVDKELVIRTGEAAKIVDPVAVKFTGTFDAVISYWLIRKKDVIKEFITRSRLEYSKKGMSITLIINEQKSYQDVISGVVVLNPDLASFGINNETTWTLEAFHKQIKLKRHLFASKEQHADLLKKLTTQKANIQTDFGKDSDNRGNKSNDFSRKVTTDLPFTFDLLIEPYKGYGIIQFPVEIYVDSRDSSLVIQLFSAGLVEELEKIQDHVFETTLKHFEGIPQMEK
jgi:hypothetical protein